MNEFFKFAFFLGDVGVRERIQKMRVGMQAIIATTFRGNVVELVQIKTIASAPAVLKV